MTDRWFWRQRMEWIHEMLRIYRFINRKHLQDKFYISTPQAAKDFSDYQLNFGDMFYDTNRKCYRPKKDKGK